MPAGPRRLFRSGSSELWEERPGEYLLRTNAVRDAFAFAAGVVVCALAFWLMYVALTPLEPRRAGCWLPLAALVFFLASPVALARRRWRGRPIARVLARDGILRLFLITRSPAHDDQAYLDLPLSAPREVVAQNNFPPEGKEPPRRWIPNCWVLVRLAGETVVRLGFTEKPAHMDGLARILAAAAPQAPPSRLVPLPADAAPRDVETRLAVAGFLAVERPMRRCLATPHTMDFLRAAWRGPDDTRVEYLKWPLEDPFLLVVGAGVGRVVDAVAAR